LRRRIAHARIIRHGLRQVLKSVPLEVATSFWFLFRVPLTLCHEPVALCRGRRCGRPGGSPKATQHMAKHALRRSNRIASLGGGGLVTGVINIFSASPPKGVEPRTQDGCVSTRSSTVR
jgi:hypothetical protein